MYLKALSLLWALSLVSGNVLYFKPQAQQDEIVNEFDQDDSLYVIVRDPVEKPESKVGPKDEPAVRPPKGVMCPDRLSECPDDTTCCKLANGRYGCCPYPEAVCCSDMKHCCRQGYTCNLSKGCCEKGNTSVPLMSKLSAIQLITAGQNTNKDQPDVLKGSLISGAVEICHGGDQSCENGHSCCMNTNGTYSCCGYSPAHCCDDKIHCCPASYKCLHSGVCEDRNGFQLPWSRKVEATALRVKANIACPDKSQCAAGKTCCLKGVKVYGCCPLPNAICCKDLKHCCPRGYQCGAKIGTCMRGFHVIDLTMETSPDQSDELTSDHKVTDEGKELSTNVICPDKKSECKTGQTCCKGVSLGYGCCPMPNAVCCKDGIHCCPAKTTCDTGSGKCLPGNGLSMNWLEKTESRPIASLSDVVCPDGKSECPSGNTCCKVEGDRYGCCPRPNAVCCEDKKHCCPEGKTCNTGAGTCTGGNGLSMAWLEKTESRPIASLSDVVCPDGKSECPSGNTCCKVEGDRYGCCPRPNAVCCEDKKHCCPEGKTCNTGAGTCTGGNGLSMAWLEKTESRPIASLSDVVCPDGKSECPSGNTCCKVEGDKYGCCPRPNAECCKDMKHCCPQGYHCEATGGKCSKGGHVIDWLEKSPSVSKSTGGVCCGDQDGHCCPAGYTCNIQEQNCFKEGHIIEWFTKVNEMSVRNVVCPDGKSECPTGNTCCLGVNGKYGCCPQPNAVCCEDKKHCCQENTKCDPTYKRCIHNNGMLTDWFTKTESRPVDVSVNEVCPDKQSQCPSGSTCCPVEGGGYGCCPSPKAVCCPDKKHCCPHGHTCDTGSGKCVGGNNQLMDWLEKTESRPIASLSDVVCPDGKSECPSGNTCCKVEGDRYGCCPTPNAVCCEDKKHCCPAGKTCNTGAGTCTGGNGLSMAWLEKTESRPITSLSDVICPGGKSTCPSGNTCCPIGGGTYGCCPRANAVCCDDMKHCCPENTKCDTAEGKCISRNGSSIEWLEKSESVLIKHESPSMIVPATNDIKDSRSSIDCPGGGSCPNNNTCCKDSTGNEGCCPYAEAVCCSDGLYCCPHGYICDTDPMICRMPEGIKRKDFNSNLLLQRIASKQRKLGGKN